MNRERSFGLSVGTVSCLLAALSIWRGRLVAAEAAGAIGVALIGLGMARPTLLTLPSRTWFAVARLLGWFNARVLLTLVFALLLMPLGLLWRVTGADPLQRRRARWTGWTPYPARYREKQHYNRMY